MPNRSFILPVILATLSMLAIGCREVPDGCADPYIMVGNECCVDSNSNGICDTFELAADENETEAPDEVNELIPSRQPEAKEPEPKLSINLSQLEEGINISYYPLKKYAFNDVKRENLTGIAATYDVRSSTQFNILKIKKPYNYLYHPENFTQFITKNYDLSMKNAKINANSYIDYQQLTESTWDGVTYLYTHELNATKIRGKDAFFEFHLVLFEREGKLKDMSSSLSLYVQCSPELIVEMQPTPTFWTIYTIGSPAKQMQDEFASMLIPERPKMIVLAEKIDSICAGDIEKFSLKPNEVIFYGVDGFNPDQITVNSSEPLVIYNQNNRDEVMIYQLTLDEPRKTLYSPQFQYDEIYSVAMEPGNYTLSAMYYSPKAKVIVR